ncbi:Serine/threonine-protein kinase PrkC [Pseudobythopirellula maris]|uniref:non-specific serine/threonine protein kinase n=1 Tax=Pseudobythopirellula maris TaxID=2527991 RepID=A0A5C5ZHA8_9BACT|nr:serine/threonine-protein kinase [Pseudobythopirellula maris]TWT86261.1 Serine/threonine-protein kinase PrkC [Pseudobythopirellula maris]
MEELTGKTIGDYRLLRPLGRGGMAHVYLAEQRSLARKIAVKVLNRELSGDRDYVDRFQQEARAAASLVHANIVQIYEVGAEDGLHYIAQEFVPGRNLGELIAAHGPMAPGVVLDVMRQVAAALAPASELGLVHRDIKPENLMLGPAGEVKVADFGLARVSQAEDTRLTRVGVTMGTPLYMSPEQVEGREVDVRSDLYSLGVTAYHLLSGGPPFSGDTALAIAVQHLQKEPEPLSIRMSTAPRSLSELIHRLLAKDPAKRPQTPQALLVELRDLARTASVEGWGDGPEDWGSIARASAALSPASGAGLDELMLQARDLERQGRDTARALRKPRLWLAIGGLLVGALLGWGLAPTTLANRAASGAEVEETVRAQLFRAKTADTPEAWRAVIERFPDEDPFYHHLAMRGLVERMFADGHFEEARPYLMNLAALGSDQEEFRLFGQAGLAVLGSRGGRGPGARDALSAFPAESLGKLEAFSPVMAQAFLDARAN